MIRDDILALLDGRELAYTVTDCRPAGAAVACAALLVGAGVGHLSPVDEFATLAGEIFGHDR